MKGKYSFKDDYSEGAHPRILDALKRENPGQEEGYGMDQYSLSATKTILEIIGQPEAAVHFVSGGTQANLLVLSSMLKPFESVIAPESAHINIHETGAIEAAGHKIHAVSTADGTLKIDHVKKILNSHVDEHMVLPRAVYISHPTEYGTLYSQSRLRALSGFCRQHGLFLYLDGARLAMALTSQYNDLSLTELASLVDAFYIGGTKNGLLLGEAIVITNPHLQPHFRYVMKQKGALLAKGRIFGIQFSEIFRDNLIFHLGKLANDRAQKLALGLRQAGFDFWMPPITNQIFPILPDALIHSLEKKYDFYVWTALDGNQSVIRLVTSWATTEEAVDEFIAHIS